MKITKKTTTANTYALSRRIICSHCGWNYHLRKNGSNHNRWKCGLKANHTTLCKSKTLSEADIIEMIKKALNQRYDFEKSDILKRLRDDLERVNKNDRFEFHRMSHLMSLILAKEELSIAEESKKEPLAEKVENLEKQIVSFEELASRIEEDRNYRDKALEFMMYTKNLEEFFRKADASILRAWVMEIHILTQDDYQVRWMDDSYTEQGNFIPLAPRREFKTSKLKKQNAGIDIATKTKDDDLTQREHKKETKGTEGGSGNSKSSRYSIKRDY